MKEKGKVFGKSLVLTTAGLMVLSGCAANEEESNYAQSVISALQDTNSRLDEDSRSQEVVAYTSNKGICDTVTEKEVKDNEGKTLYSNAKESCEKELDKIKNVSVNYYNDDYKKYADDVTNKYDIDPIDKFVKNAEVDVDLISSFEYLKEEIVKDGVLDDEEIAKMDEKIDKQIHYLTVEAAAAFNANQPFADEDGYYTDKTFDFAKYYDNKVYLNKKLKNYDASLLTDEDKKFIENDVKDAAMKTLEKDRQERIKDKEEREKAQEAEGVSEEEDLANDEGVMDAELDNNGLDEEDMF